jgi:peptide/nickel transport system permease protein
LSSKEAGKVPGLLVEGPGPPLLIEGPGPPLLDVRPRARRPRFLRGVFGFIVRRLLLGVVTLFVASLIIFAATQALPGDTARSILGRGAQPAALAELRRQLGLDKPVLEQYLDWIGGVVTGDLGTSLAAGLPVSEVIGERIGYSAFLMLLAAVFSIPLAVLIGAVSARRRDGPFDHAVSVVTLALAALPEFVVGIVLVVLFATTIVQWFPAVTVIDPGTAPWSHPKELVLPTLTLVIAVTPYIARIMRASMVEILESDYVEMARLKGLPERIVLWRHAVPNGIAPTFQVIAINLAYLAGGIVVVEAVFNYPGIGSGFVDAVRSRDMPVVQALSLLIAGLYVVLNLLADLATILVSPRLRTALK